jgi:hypothetical protein
VKQRDSSTRLLQKNWVERRKEGKKERKEERKKGRKEDRMKLLQRPVV